MLESVAVNGELNETWNNSMQLRNTSCSIIPGENSTLLTYPQVAGNISGIDDVGIYVREIQQDFENWQMKWTDDVRLCSRDEYLEVNSRIVTLDSTEQINVQTYATGAWRFDIYFGDDPIWTEVNLETIGEYTTNVK